MKKQQFLCVVLVLGLAMLVVSGCAPAPAPATVLLTETAEPTASPSPSPTTVSPPVDYTVGQAWTVSGYQMMILFDLGSNQVVRCLQISASGVITEGQRGEFFVDSANALPTYDLECQVANIAFVAAEEAEAQLIKEAEEHQAYLDGLIEPYAIDPPVEPGSLLIFLTADGTTYVLELVPEGEPDKRTGLMGWGPEHSGIFDDLEEKYLGAE